MKVSVRSTFCSLLALAALLTIAPLAGAATTASLGGAHIHASMSPKVIRDSTKHVEATLTIRTGTRSLERSISVVTPHFQRRLGGLWLDENTTLGYSNGLRTTGPVKQLGYAGGENYRIPACKVEIRGEKANDATYSFSIPKRSTVRLRFRFSVAKNAPWANSSYAPSFEFWKGSPEAARPANGAQRTVAPRRPRIKRAIAPRIDLTFPASMTIDPPIGYFGFATTELPVGSPFQLSGRVVPAVSGAHVHVLQNGPQQTDLKYVEFASATTEPDGRFTIPTPLTIPDGVTFLRTRLSLNGSSQIVDDACPFAISGL